MTAFDDAFAAVIGEEGGYVDDPQDAGGETKFGISKRSYPGVDIKALTLDTAKHIYNKDYWTPIQGDSLPPKMALAVFDMAVNAGVATSVKMMQRALGLSDDGVIGPATIAAGNKIDLKAFAVSFAVERLLHYAIQPSFPRFGRGWFTRAVSVAINNS